MLIACTYKLRSAEALLYVRSSDRLLKKVPGSHLRARSNLTHQMGGEFLPCLLPSQLNPDPLCKLLRVDRMGKLSGVVLYLLRGRVQSGIGSKNSRISHRGRWLAHQRDLRRLGDLWDYLYGRKCLSRGTFLLIPAHFTHQTILRIGLPMALVLSACLDELSWEPLLNGPNEIVP